jgi:flagellar biosynthesis protein FlhB
VSEMSQKTERATPKRRREAREKGNVLKSADVSTAAVLMAVFAGIKLLGSTVVSSSATMLQDWLTRPASANPLTIAEAAKVLGSAIVSIASIGAPMVVVGVLVALGANYAQVGFLFSTKALQPKMNRINPMEGFKRVFSVRSVAELLKAVLKIVALGFVAWQEYVKIVGQFASFAMQGILAASASMADMAMNIAMKMALVLLAIAAADYFYQWWHREREMRMSKQEVKDEYKLTEGDPQVKNRIRQKQRQMGMMRMMQSIPQANVVITNPTHYAIALRYKEGKDSAPVVVAKGKDFLAQRIKEEARKCGIEMVENRPLAQSLYVFCDVGDSVPKDMYKAVAEVLAYVYRLKHPARAREKAAT